MKNSDKDIGVRRRSRIPIQDCGLGLAADIFGDRWIILILREAFYAVIRFEDIQKDISIPRSVLTARLARLVELGLLMRQPYREPNSRTRFSYHLTPKGRKAAMVLMAMMEWGNENLLNNSPKLQIIDGQSKLALRLGLIDSNGNEVPSKKVALEPIAKLKG